MGYIDLHSHVLFGLDDGAPDREASLAMLDALASLGVTELGNEVADYALARQTEAGITYVIWMQRINSGDGRGWRDMEDRGSITQNHYDHVHVSFEETAP